MTSTLITDTITAELQALSQDEKRKVLPRFFKTGKGEYGEGDAFLGVVVPDVRGVARKHKAANPDEPTIPPVKRSSISICRSQNISTIGIWLTSPAVSSSANIS